MKKIIIVTSGHFPEGDAGAIRLLYMAKAMIEAGFNVTVLCRGKYGNGSIDAISYVSFREKHSNILSKVKAYMNFYHNVVSYLKNNGNIDCVYIYDAPASVFNFCKRKLKAKGVSLIYDCVEWYSPEQFKHGRYSYAFRQKNRIVTQIIDSSFSVITISKYLEDYFVSKGIHTIRVPVLCDVVNIKENKKCGDKLTLFYAGLPQSKDLIGNLLEAVLLLSPEDKQKLKIVLVGSSIEHLIQKCGISKRTLNECLDILELYPRMPRNEVLSMMKNADFVVLIRDASLRYAKAGFPSKIVESLANATPVFCNLSSDLNEYLNDGENALLVSSHRIDDIAKSLHRGIGLTIKKKESMGIVALESAKRYFDYRKYVPELQEFINEM